ncbi:MAG: ABC transporter substrate-binding protein [Microthrixaceae bacterium]
MVDSRCNEASVLPPEPRTADHLPGHRRTVRRASLFASMLAVLALLAGACGSDDGSSEDGDGTETETAAEGEPSYGGELRYAIEAANSGGWCLPEAELAISGIQVAKAIYDTLTAPNADGEYVPFLAQSVEPNETFDQWTITLREGVKFHDGTDLTAEVVKNNLDAYRGEYPARQPLLTVFVFENLTSVDIVDDLTLTVTTASPWPAFPAYLYYSGRIGIMAQAQLDDQEFCDSDLIGTGPFVFEDWVPGDTLSATRNENYWMSDSDGNQLPYLDEVEFVTITEPTVRTNALLSGDINALHNTSASETEALRAAADDGDVKIYESTAGAESSYLLFNSGKAPFNNILARQAAAYALDREEMRQVVYLDINEIASGPFAPGVMGYLEDTGMPEHDLEMAKDLVAQYESETGEPFEFTAVILNTGTSIQTAQFVQEQFKQAGITMNIRQVEQAAEIDTALGDDWEMLDWRQHPGDDPDTQYIWWASGLPTNFNKMEDPEIDRLLEEGRVETDPAKRTEIYEELNRYFAEQLYNVWTVWVNAVIATADDVDGINGVFGPNLPDGSAPTEILGGGHPITGMWIAS